MKNKFKLAVVGLLTMTVLAACGGGSTNDTTDGSKSDAGTDQLSKIKEAGKIVMATSPDFPPAEFYILKDGKKEIVGSIID